jgi:hypothetical protein
MWGTDPQRGHIRSTRFKDIAVTGGHFPSSEILGCDKDHLIEDVMIENLRIHGQPIKSAADGRFTLNPFTKNVQFRGE